MSVKIVSKAEKGAKTGVAQYWERLSDALTQRDIRVDWIVKDDWTRGAACGDPNKDIIIVDNQDALDIPGEYGVIAVQHGCAGENVFRNYGCKQTSDLQKLLARQQRAARRKRTIWVAVSAWCAHFCRMHMGVQADRIIYGMVDSDIFFPAERQRARDATMPVVLHHCKDPNKGAGIIDRVAGELAGEFEVRRLDCAPGDVAEHLREADMWLCLSASEGAPTVVMEALTTGLVVVGTNVGVLWPYCQAMRPEESIQSRQAGAMAWLNRDIGAVVFDWKHRAVPEAIADYVRGAWRNRAELHGDDYARQWYSKEMFGQKWIEVVQVATKQFELAGTGGGVALNGKPRPAEREAVRA